MKLHHHVEEGQSKCLRCWTPVSDFNEFPHCTSKYDAHPGLATRQIKQVLSDAFTLSDEEWSDKYDPARMGYSDEDLIRMYLDGYASYKHRKWFNDFSERIDRILQKYVPMCVPDDSPQFQLGSRIALLITQYRKRL